MQLQNPLGVVAPTLEAPVLAVLARAEQSFTGRQVHRLAGRGTEQGVRNALERLVERGVVHRSTVGASYAYRLNRAHLAAPHLIGLATLRDELFTRWRSRIAAWPITPRLVTLFGSAARNDMRPDSDIDLLVVTDDDAEALADAITSLQVETTVWTGNDTRVLHIDAHDVSADEPVLVTAADEGVTIVGDPLWLRRALTKGADGGP